MLLELWKDPYIKGKRRKKHSIIAIQKVRFWCEIVSARSERESQTKLQIGPVSEGLMQIHVLSVEKNCCLLFINTCKKAIP